MSEPLMVCVAPNGARKTKQDHAGLPLSTTEIVDEAENCMRAGASMIHLHVRDENGKHTIEAKHYRPVIKAIRERLGHQLIIQATTEAVGQYSWQQQMAMVRELKPEAVSLAIKELCPAGNEQNAALFFSWLVECRIYVQYILYSVADIERFIDLHSSGVIPNTNPSILLVLGRYSKDLSSEPADLLSFLEALKDFDCIWSVCAFGAKESDCMILAAQHGGHVRIGFENNMLMPDASVASNNASLIYSFAERATKLGLAIASTPQTKEALSRTF